MSYSRTVFALALVLRFQGFSCSSTHDAEVRVVRRASGRSHGRNIMDRSAARERRVAASRWVWDVVLVD